ncbi:type I-MYXAN CRISPR-associated protein Cas6/Cmx6 [Parasulfuritortus cantonensis]|uniref:Type I-MYXAN CRISPR-associated protein Cas6/Cmx6 n=1 Tax=Parasulfuritortus cantonensis TaxID=2528202 RepID=A0A4R1BEY5_9PROT|nr:type I-MYXAN CRISPR-associated protein Cas6/Cmx6 [Parasulfuritortus cantonensis]TCJ15699.1 type I-MYXAN CRISPR-associated protein Cas6/Cmx6 [Parasulfuritortus cantonensis]
MRMYNPEWEAIKDYAYVARCKDVQFDLTGNEIPADHGYALFEALARLLPWLRETADVGVHAIHGAPTGRNENLVINRRVKLVLRLPVDRVADALALVGQRIETGAGALQIGAAKEKALTPYATLYAPLVDFGTGDEVAFLEAARAELDKMAIRCGLIPGKKRKMHTPGGRSGVTA